MMLPGFPDADSCNGSSNCSYSKTHWSESRKYGRTGSHSAPSRRQAASANPG